MFRATQPFPGVQDAGDRVTTFSPHRILVAVDQSDPASWATTIAAQLARRFRAELGLVHAVAEATYLAPDPGEPTGGLEQHIVHCGEEFLTRLHVDVPSNLRVDRFLREGVAEREILATARAWRADLIAIGTHGRRGLQRVLLGSTAESVIRQSECPVLCVGQKPRRCGGFERVLVAVDASEQASGAAKLAFALARAFSACVALAHVPLNPVPLLPVSAFAGASAYDAEIGTAKTFLDEFHVPEGIHAERLVPRGPAADGILTSALEWDADLIVIGTHGRRGVARLVLGSTAESVLRRAACPVLCVGHHKNGGAS